MIFGGGSLICVIIVSINIESTSGPQQEKSTVSVVHDSSFINKANENKMA